MSSTNNIKFHFPPPTPIFCTLLSAISQKCNLSKKTNCCVSISLLHQCNISKLPLRARLKCSEGGAQNAVRAGLKCSEGGAQNAVRAGLSAVRAGLSAVRRGSKSSGGGA